MTILYFAWLKQKTGTGREEIAVPETVRTVADLVAFLEELSPGHKAAFERKEAIRVAVDQAFAKPDTIVSEAREIAFFPPVTGG